jgi:hypothetical protein
VFGATAPIRARRRILKNTNSKEISRATAIFAIVPIRSVHASLSSYLAQTETTALPFGEPQPGDTLVIAAEKWEDKDL